MRVEIRSAFGAGAWAAPWIFAGTYIGINPGLPPGGGQACLVGGSSIFEPAGGKFRRTAD